MIKSGLLRLKRDDKGVALIEFALTAPIMIALYLGGYQLCDAISAKRKVTTTARALADLTSQFGAVVPSDLDQILNASQQIMSPYSVNNAQLVIIQASTNNAGVTTVAWSRGKNVTGPAAGTTFSVPATIKQNNTSLIVAQVTYTYVPIAAGSLIGNIPMTETIIMSPRVSDNIVCTGC